MIEKFKIKNIVLLLLVAVFLAVIPVQEAMANEFEVSRYHAVYEVQPNGDVKVTEDITYDFSFDANGIFRDIDTNLGEDIPNTPANQVDLDYVSVAVLEDGAERPIYMTDEGAGEDGLFEFYETQQSKVYRLKVFEKTSHDSKTFRFSYTLTNAVTKFNDIATFNWKMIDRNWEVYLRDVKMTIKIPEGAEKSDLRIYSHGDLTGFNEILDAQTFNVQVEVVEPGTMVENLVIFPLDLVPDSQKIIPRTELPTILERETELAEQANIEREEAKKRVEEYRKQQEAERQAEIARQARNKKMNPFLWILGALGLGGSGFVARKYGRERKPEFQGDYYRELPGDYTPAVMTYLLENGNIESKDIMATLMDLSRKGIIAIEPYEKEKRSLFGNKTETDYRLVSRRPQAEELKKLTNHEQFLFDWFINDLGNGSSLVMDDLEATLKKESNARQFNRDYDQFKSYIAGMGESLNFREANKTKGSGIFFLLGFVLFAIAVLVVVYFNNMMGLVPGIAGVIMLSTTGAMAVKRKLTQYGSNQVAMWKAFKRFLETFSNMDKAEIPALTIWNHYLVYATSLGIAKEVIEQLPKAYSPQELNDPTFTRTFYPSFYSGRGFAQMDRTLNQAMSTATQTIQKAEAVASSRRSSSMGGGGGFSGGSSGGGGGGGGGGAF